jgi:hypothetical protein
MDGSKTQATGIISQRLPGLSPEFGEEFDRMFHSSLLAAVPTAS